MIDYKKRLVEVDEILDNMSYEDLSKIPETVRNFIKETKDKNYFWNFDKTKNLKNQNLNRDTMIILSYLNMEYMLSSEQKILMEQIHKLNEKNRIRIVKSNNISSMFNKVNNEKIEESENKSIANIKTENVFIRFIKNIFK